MATENITASRLRVAGSYINSDGEDATASRSWSDIDTTATADSLNEVADAIGEFMTATGFDDYGNKYRALTSILAE